MPVDTGVAKREEDASKRVREKAASFISIHEIPFSTAMSVFAACVSLCAFIHRVFSQGIFVILFSTGVISRWDPE